MKILNLLEKRKNHEHPAQQRPEGMAIFDRYINMSEEEISKYFVSFTTIEKLGINVSSTNDHNPIGIYTYPMWYILRAQGKLSSSAPYAADNPHVWVVTPTKPIFDVSDYRVYDGFASDCKKLREYVVKSTSIVDDGRGAEFLDSYFSTNRRGNLSTRGDIYRMVNGACNIISTLKRNNGKMEAFGNGTLKLPIIYEDRYGSRTQVKVPYDATLANVILRKLLGHKIIYDGSGEYLGAYGALSKIQCVFLDTSAFKIVEKLNNNSIHHNGIEDKNIGSAHKMSRKMREFSQQSTTKKFEDACLLNDNTRRMGYYTIYYNHVSGTKYLMTAISYDYADELSFITVDISTRETDAGMLLLSIINGDYDSDITRYQW